MSQTTFPFADTDTSTEAWVEDAPENKRNVLIVAVAAAVAVLFLGWFLFLRGGSDPAMTGFPHAPRAAGVAAQKPAVKAPTTKKLPTAYKAEIGRDPFKALYVVPVSQPASNVAPVATTPVAPVAAAPASSGSTSSSTSTSTSTTTSRYALKLISISKPSGSEVQFFTWSVAGKRTVVIPAQRFGKYGELVVLAYEHNAAGTVTGAVIQVGDDTPIDVSIGETISVL
jgi:hypothetical protein